MIYARVTHELAREVVFESGLRLPEGTPVVVTRHSGGLVEIRWQETGTTGHVWAGDISDVRVVTE